MDREIILLTGSNGYFGPYIIKELVMQGYSIIANKYKHPNSRVFKNEYVKYLYFDITDIINYENKILEIANGKIISAVIHVAALCGDADYDNNYKVNVKGTEALISFAKKFNIKRFLHISTICEIKIIQGPYGVTKTMGAELVRNSKLDYTVFIPALILGPQSLGFNRICENLFRFPLFTPLVGNGMATQHPIYVKDFAKILILSIKNNKSINKTYQIAGKELITFKDFLKMILKIKNRKKIFIPIPVNIVKLFGKIFESLFSIPPFTSEHVIGLTQSSKLDPKQLYADFGFEPMPLNIALKETLQGMEDYKYYLNAHEEKEIKL